ncbi:hypothetical protein CH289_07845 [Rhodococcus sp. RS1C4]|nr:single-stranded DNA-binding protein [Rhodococcus sp. RS1C4]OZC55094.1 hypothetical protein CH289_07845 [Rhodococcus sp. RS1C4]
MSATTTIIGSLGKDPELRYTPAGVAVCNINVAVTERVKQNEQWVDGITTWFRCNVWRDYAEHVSESLRKGDQVFVTGRLKNRPYEKDGVERLALEIDVDEIGPTLRFATAQVQKANRSGGQKQQSSGGSDPWATGPAGDSQPPF